MRDYEADFSSMAVLGTMIGFVAIVVASWIIAFLLQITWG